MTAAYHGPCVIWKYRLAPGEVITNLQVPADTEVLSAAAQGADICVWAKVPVGNINIRTRLAKIVVVPTGHAFLDQGMRFLGTTLLLEGGLVFHVFEEVSP